MSLTTPDLRYRFRHAPLPATAHTTTEDTVNISPGLAAMYIGLVWFAACALICWFVNRYGKVSKQARYGTQDAWDVAG